MPLVVITGFPCSGKSQFAQQLKDYLEESRGCNVHVVTDDYEKTPRNECYSSSAKEKESRGALKSSAERLLSTSDVIVLDSLNYIKGFRYELYCVVRQLKTVHCVVQCGASEVQCREWNGAREEACRYDEDTLSALVQRYEHPDSRNRWDSPLYVVIPGESPPLEDVAKAVLEKAPKPAKQSTQSQPLSAPDFLQELERQTKAVVEFAVAAQRTQPPPCSLWLPGVTPPLQLPHAVNLPELNRQRRQFVTFTKLHPPAESSSSSSSSSDLIQTLFVQYLNRTL